MGDAMKKLNLAFRGGASKLPSYLRFMKELDARGGYKAGRLSGSSAGGITAAAIACGYTAEGYFKRLCQMPGERTMRMERRLEKGKWWEKIIYALPVYFTAKGSLSDKLEKYFKDSFNWSIVPAGVDLFIGFALQSELAKASGLASDFTFYDLYRVFTTKDASSLAKEVFIYFAAKDGVYCFNKAKKRLDKISESVIPLHLAVFSTMWNPVFHEIDLKIDGATQHPFDGGICDNYAVTAQTDPFVSVACIAKEADNPEGSLSDYYRTLGPKPVKTIYCAPVEKDKSFFQFDDATLKKEFAVPPTNALEGIV
jgi:hypothetical protein